MSNAFLLANGNNSNRNGTQNIELVDDFINAIGMVGNTRLHSVLSWFTSNAHDDIIVTATENGHPGIIQNDTLDTVTLPYFTLLGGVDVVGANYRPSIVFGGGEIVCGWVFKIVNLSTGTNRYSLRLGLGDTDGIADQANGCYFEYSDNLNSGNWVFKTANSSSRTPFNTSIPVTTGWHKIEVIVNAAGTSVNFALDGIIIDDLTTNIPSSAVSPLNALVCAAGNIAAGTVQTDLVYFNQILTVSR